ncbi:MAG TPA: molybdopterin molybdotransferase MoeA [Steroidobacteraceae bacterium]|jgi:molybdopterin molybdotransferase
MLSPALSPAAAEAIIRERVVPTPSQFVPLANLIGGVLREPIVATRDQPPFDRVTMDGIAFSSAAAVAGRREFRIAGTQAAGAPQKVLAKDDACFEVMTGAVLPTGCDCVIPVERITITDGSALLQDDVVPTAGLNVHRRAVDCTAGSVVLQPGTRLGPPEVAVIASAGFARACVSRAPSIIVISTGDELIEPGEPVNDSQIYRSNVYGVMAALQRRGFANLAQDHLPDNLDILRVRLQAHLQAHDVLILSGGVSMGKFDYIPQVLAELGVAVVFHKVAQRPGKPMWFGIGRNGQAVYALPGNPVSTLACLARYVFSGLATAIGAAPAPAEMVSLAEDVEVKVALTMFFPVRLAVAENGQVRALPRPTRGSGDFTSLLGTDGCVELPPGPAVIYSGTRVPFYRW